MALTYAGVSQVGDAGVIEHGQHRVHPQACLGVGVFLMASGVSVGVNAGCQKLQLLQCAGSVGANRHNSTSQGLAACIVTTASHL